MSDGSSVRGIGGFVKKNKQKEKSEEIDDRPIRRHKLFKTIKPKKHYRFGSDYFKIDDSYATILSIFHDKGADDKLPPFWGIHLTPRNLTGDDESLAGVSVRKLEHVSRVSESWVDSHQGRAEGLLNNMEGEVRRDGSYKQKQRLGTQQQQLAEIAHELNEGSSYLRVAIRLLVKAPTLEALDKVVEKINRQYKDAFDTVRAAAYIGEQKNEFRNLLGPIERKQGRNFMFTSRQFSGSYNLVTRGIEDKTGEYIGSMHGDINNSAVLMDLDGYDRNVVVAGQAKFMTLSMTAEERQKTQHKGVDAWGVKLGMSALLRNRRVVHLVLNGADINNIGVDLSDITSNVNMTRGDINPFELFGDIEDELTLFPAHLEKISLMVEQLQATNKDERAIVKGELKTVLNEFYADKKMWVRNAQENRDAIRLVGLNHNEIPQLPEFLAYLKMRYNALVNKSNRDNEVVHAYNFLRTAFRDMLDTNGDLFNTVTSSIIDKAAISHRVIYDFSSLIRRSKGLMMAQFVNALGFAVGNLSAGDVVIFHGVNYLVPEVRDWVAEQLDLLYSKDVRTVFIYDKVESMLNDVKFNRFDMADYTLLGTMADNTIKDYEKLLGKDIPINLKNLLAKRDPMQYYIRRGLDNVVFRNDMLLGVLDV